MRDGIIVRMYRNRVINVKITKVIASVILFFTKLFNTIHLGKNPKNGGTPPILIKFTKKEIFNKLFFTVNN